MFSSLSYDHFRAYVNGKVQERKAKTEEKRNMTVSMIPAFQEALKKTSLLGVENGRGADLLKVGSKRRRTKAQIEAEKQAKEEE